uniref:Phosphodiesterase n=1 Tax=Albugo laibachii Nc14 TaxID=890382 RepID=F0W4Q1_9STRA|nr:cAMPspecific 3' putative [Albugo laibachii Nc14]|eukprot:CCA16086.1 cAMPspecific 3' putative [Albugo laibachii Nc14]
METPTTDFSRGLLYSKSRSTSTSTDFMDPVEYGLECPHAWSPLSKSRSSLDILHSSDDIFLQRKLSLQSFPQSATLPRNLSWIQAWTLDSKTLKECMHQSASDLQPLESNSVCPKTRNASSRMNSLSWEDLCDEQVVEEDAQTWNEVELLQSCGPQKRSRDQISSYSMLGDVCIVRICQRLEIDTQHINRIVEIVHIQIGTRDMNMPQLASLLGEQLFAFLGLLAFEDLHLMDKYIDQDALVDLLRHIQARYMAKNPFHNACHAADVMHTMYTLLAYTHLRTKISPHLQVAAILASVMHDIEHVGLTNDFLVKSEHRIAREYISKAPMEAMHANLAILLLLDEKFRLMDRFPVTQREEIIHVVVETILSTALSSQRDMLQQVRDMDFSSIKTLIPLPFDSQLSILRLVLHISDIGQTMKPFPIHQMWAERLNEENFLQGDMERKLHLCITTKCCDRRRWDQAQFCESQVDFLQSFALPAIQTLQEVPWMHVEAYVKGIEGNIEQWRRHRSEL